MRLLRLRAILARIYPHDQVEEKIRALKASIIELYKEGSDTNLLKKLKQAWDSKVFRRGLKAGITVQIAQPFLGINAVMYYSPAVLELAGFASKSIALALSLTTSGLNVMGSFVSMVFVDRDGRRKLMVISMLGTIACLIVWLVYFTILLPLLLRLAIMNVLISGSIPLAMPI
ncbi:hypothetical protein BVRB_8g194930 [Beta vulgaris subsp. vulgaris]|nr:hypothetical protein BVRB_8g194930 [Beta vulgaris subsp. vulgaris]